VTSTIILVSTDSSGQLTTVSSVISSTITNPNSASTPGLVGGGSSGSGSGSSSHTGAIAGGVVGGVIGLALLALLGFLLMRRSRRKAAANRSTYDYDVGAGQGFDNPGADKQVLAKDDAHNDRYNAVSTNF